MNYTRLEKKKWQKSYIKSVFKCAKSKKEKYTNVLLENLDIVNKKSEYIPKRLFKFYTPTSDNILDIKCKKLWLSHPDSFNDPYDCKVGYDSLGFEKTIVLDYIFKKHCVESDNSLFGFTKSEIEKLSRATTSWERYNSIFSIDYYEFLFYHLLRKKDEKFQRTIRTFIQSTNEGIENQVAKIRKTNIRVACFCNLNDEEFLKKNQMWAHYADNHRGFCVEYDITPLKNELAFKHDYFRYDDTKEEYLDERREVILKGGLFPLIYTSNRVSIPISRLVKLHSAEQLDLDNDNYYDELLYKTYITKSSVWSYEKEWRFILDDKICDYYDNKIPFPYIKKIYLGCRMEKRYIELLLDIAEENNINIVFMREDGHKYNLNADSGSLYKWEKESKMYNYPYKY